MTEDMDKNNELFSVDEGEDLSEGESEVEIEFEASCMGWWRTWRGYARSRLRAIGEDDPIQPKVHCPLGNGERYTCIA
jgi:hypothetical protein